MKFKLPDKFRKVELKEVSDYINDKVSIENCKTDNYISTTNMIEDKGGKFLADSLPKSKSVNSFKKEDILVSNIRPYFKKIWFATFDGTSSSDVLIFRPKEYMFNKFLYYVLSDNDFFAYSTKSAKGTKMPRGDKKAIMNYLVPEVSFQEQIQIAETLSFLDKKIELNNKINENLEKQAQAIFKHWFVEFEFLDNSRMPYKSSGGEMVDSKLGAIPRGWKIEKLDGIIENVKNTTKPGEHLKNRRYIPINNMTMKSVTIEQSESYKEAKSSLVLFEEFDILIGAMRVYFHRVNIAPFKGVTRTTSFVLRSKNKDKISYDLFLLNLNETINYANKTSRGTTMPYAVWENGLAEMIVANPPQNIKREFNNIIFPVLKKMMSNAKENRYLTNLRDLLLPKLMSGEIRIPLD